MGAGGCKKARQTEQNEGLKDCMPLLVMKLSFLAGRGEEVNPQILSVFKFPFCIFSPNYFTRLLTSHST